MSKQWKPKNWDDICKRNAGRRKLHMRMRKARADRILRVLAAMQSAPELRESAYGWLSLAAQTMKKSTATASRDFALARRVHGQFARLFGRELDPTRDQIKWSWNWSHYGFRTRESVGAGYKKPVGNFPFDTRAEVTEDAYCNFGPRSWIPEHSFSNPRDLLSTLRLMARIRPT